MSDPGFLSSDVLEGQFGPTTLKILQQNDSERVICTKTADGRTLELSWVIFDSVGVAAFPKAHKAVVAGESIGKAFRARGERFERRTLSVNHRPSAELTGRLSRLFAASGQVTIVEVSIFIGDTHYADILEIYSPEVIWPQNTK